MPELHDLLGQYPILRSLASSLKPKELIAIACVSKTSQSYIIGSWEVLKPIMRCGGDEKLLCEERDKLFGPTWRDKLNWLDEYKQCERCGYYTCMICRVYPEDIGVFCCEECTSARKDHSTNPSICHECLYDDEEVWLDLFFIYTEGFRTKQCELCRASLPPPCFKGLSKYHSA